MLHELAAVVVGLDVHPGRQMWFLRMYSTRSCMPSRVVRRLAAVAHEDDALHDVGLVVVADDAEPRRVADVDVGDVPDADGVPFCSVMTMFSMSCDVA